MIPLETGKVKFEQSNAIRVRVELEILKTSHTITVDFVAPDFVDFPILYVFRCYEPLQFLAAH